MPVTRRLSVQVFIALIIQHLTIDQDSTILSSLCVVAREQPERYACLSSAVWDKTEI